jgi:predicted MPP superfamily phosphohydrolase
LKAWPVLAIGVVQSLLCLAHWFLYATFLHFWWPLSPSTNHAVGVALTLLSASFIFGALLGFRFSNLIVRIVYWIAAIWLGLLNFLFFASCLAWLVDFALPFLPSVSNAITARHWIASILLAASIVVSAYGILNARFIRQRNVTIRLPNLPQSWRGRTALLISDMHLGNINRISFARRIAAMARQLDPAVIFIAGDLFDGTRADPNSLASPLFSLCPPFGTFFIGGNHEEFGGASHYEEALLKAGIRVLHNQRVVVEGLQIIGVPYGHSTYPLQLRAFLEGLNLKDGPASILLNHVPNRLPVAEHAGVTLQLSGHTHGGQIFPFSWITRRAFGKFTYGLQRFGDMQVYTSSGVGTWGPPMRVGTLPEIVLLTFE